MASTLGYRQIEEPQSLERWLGSANAEEQRRADQVLSGMGHDHEILYLIELTAVTFTQQRRLHDRVAQALWWLGIVLGVGVMLTLFPVFLGAATAVLIGTSFGWFILWLVCRPILTRWTGLQRTLVDRLLATVTDGRASPVLVEALQTAPDPSTQQRIVAVLTEILPTLSSVNQLTPRQWAYILRSLRWQHVGTAWFANPDAGALFLESVMLAIARTKNYEVVSYVLDLASQPPVGLPAERVQSAALQCLAELRRSARDNAVP